LIILKNQTTKIKESKNFLLYLFRFNSSGKDEWLFRYNRNGRIRDFILKEDEEIFKDHLQALEKKQGKYQFKV
jgi:hypothetical protein